MNLIVEKLESAKFMYAPLISRRNIAAFYLVLMCIQYIPLEGWGVSPVKVVAMCAAPLIWLMCVPNITRAVVLSIIYLLWYFGTIYLRFDSPRFETMGYHVMFFAMYVTFYNLIYTGAFTAEFFLKLVKKLIYAFVIVLVIQQSLSIIGITSVPVLNFYYAHNVFKCQSLTWEPSSSARIMGALFYAFLKVSEFQNGEPLSITDLWQKHRYLICGFIYAMISMVSGTAIVCLAVLSLYFIKRKYLLLIIPLYIAAYFVVPDIVYEPVRRTYDTAEAVLGGDAEDVEQADGSAAVRINPILNSFDSDFSDPNVWLGYGIDYGISHGYYAKERTIWGDYGIINWFWGLIFVFCCCIKPFFSLPTLMFFIGIGGGIGNISYQWGILMIFTCVSYFYVFSDDKQ